VTDRDRRNQAASRTSSVTDCRRLAIQSSMAAGSMIGAVLGGLLVLAQGSVVAPFIYTLF